MRYSPSTKAFYPDHLDYPNLPEDLVPVSSELHQEWMQAPQGTTVTVAANGRVSLVSPEESDLDALKTLKVQQLRSSYAASRFQLSFAATTAAGKSAVFGNTPEDQKNVQAALELGEKAWKSIGIYLDINGSVVWPFTFDDLKALSEAMAAPVSAHAEMLKKIAAVLAAKKMEDLEAPC